MTYTVHSLREFIHDKEIFLVVWKDARTSSPDIALDLDSVN